MSIIAIDIETYAALSYEDYATPIVNERFMNGESMTKSFYAKVKKDWEAERKAIALNPRKHKIRLIQIAYENGDIQILDVQKCSAKEIDDFIELYTKSTVIVHNAKFDVKSIYVNFGVFPKFVFDTYLAAKLLFNYMWLDIVYDTKLKREVLKPQSASLKNVLHKFLDVDLAKEYGASDWGGELSKEQIKYAEDDVKYLHRLAQVMIGHLNTDSTTSTKQPYLYGLTDLITVVEMNFVVALIKIELNGCPVNSEAMLEISHSYNNRIIELDKKFAELGLNVNSPKQIKEYYKSKGILLSNTDVHTLTDMNDELSNYIIESKQLKKKQATIDSYAVSSVEDGRIYADFFQILTSGRMACSEPNLQQIPRNIKHVFYADGMVKLDYPNIEMRLAATIMQIHKLLDLFSKPKGQDDAHILTAKLVTHKTDITKHERTLAKGVNFSQLYGAGAKVLQNYLHHNFDITISLEEAEKLRNSFLNGLPEIKAYHKKIGDKLRATPIFIVTTPLGRRRLVNTYTTAINTPTQGAGADIFKIAVILYMQKYNNIINLVHDEIILDNPTEEEVEFCKECMSKATKYVIKEFDTIIDAE